MTKSSHPTRRTRWVLRGVMLLAVGVTLVGCSTALSDDRVRSALRSQTHHAASGVADGALPEGASIDSGDLPGVAKLDPALRRAVARATHAARGDGVDITINSGWRSAAYQQKLLRDAIAEHGSKAAASRWVASPKTSAHVRGEAVDIGPDNAAHWMSAHGARYGLCQIYANERWHFELRPAARSHGCPGLYADAASDPRLQR